MISTLVTFALCAVASASAASTRTIVLHDDSHPQAAYSKFFGDLESRGHELKFVKVSERAEVVLTQYGETIYDNLVWFAPRVKFAAGNPSLDNILEFIDAGHNAIVAVDSEASPTLRDFASECGVDLDPTSSVVLDHFAGKAEDASLVKSDRVTKNKLAVGDFSSSVLYRGIGFSISDETLLVMKILSGSPSSYVASSDSSTNVKSRFGSEIDMVSGLQFRNNARVLFSGSVELFSDEFALNKETRNAEFVRETSRWAFGERGVLRVSEVKHSRVNGDQPETQLKHQKYTNLPKSTFPEPEIAPNSLVYRIKDDVRFSMKIEELVNGQWVPYVANDVQLEFVMLDPYLRQNLSPSNTGVHSLDFTIPDVYGVFKFRVMYRREGYSNIAVEKQVSIRPFRHNEYERFITAAFPYYTTAFTMMAAFFTFSVVFISTK